MKFIFLTGASGSGKTTIAKSLSQRHSEIRCFFFDSIGVPSSEEMIAQYGSGEQWQRAKTIEWLEALAKEPRPLLFDGQSRIAFIQEAIQQVGLVDVEIVLVDCNDQIRRERLCGPRGQPDLANPQMMSWAKYLREEAAKNKISILDTSTQAIGESVEALLRKFI